MRVLLSRVEYRVEVRSKIEGSKLGSGGSLELLEMELLLLLLLPSPEALDEMKTPSRDREMGAATFMSRASTL